MSTYREIHGKAVKSLSTDPSAETDAGQIWYNTTSDTFKSIVSLSAWSSGANMTMPLSYRFGGGTPTATFAAGGAPSAVAGVKTEEYNGTGWSNGGDIGTSRYEGGSAGTLTAGLIYGGYFSPPASIKAETEEYNGTAWSEQTNLSTGGYSSGGFGTQTAAVFTNRWTPPGVVTAQCEEYNGSSWSGGNNSSVTRGEGGTAGTLTAGFIFGGGTPPPAVTTATELYDGTNWTTGPAMNSARMSLAGSGTQTSALAFGGRYTPPGSVLRAYTEAFDGTSWSETSDLATARRQLSSNRSNTGNSAALAFGGSPIPATGTMTEEWNISSTVITAAAWSSGANFPTTSSAVAGAGPRDAGLGIGGYPAGSPPTGKSFEYNGVAWSAEATLNPSTGTQGANSAAGTQTACICAQNTSPAPPYTYVSAGEYDGSSWSNATARPTDNYSQAMCGTQTAGLLFGGKSDTAYSAVTLSYDGTNWTAEESMSTARSSLSGSGTATAGLGAGGYSSPPATSYANTEEYGGESWTAGGALLSAKRNGRSSGTQTDCIFMGGGDSSLPLGTVNCATYNGTSWTTAPSMATTRQNFGNGATSPVGAAWGAAGYSAPGSPNRTNTTEHFNVETTAVNVKTLTQS